MNEVFINIMSIQKGEVILRINPYDMTPYLHSSCQTHTTYQNNRFETPLGTRKRQKRQSTGPNLEKENDCLIKQLIS